MPALDFANLWQTLLWPLSRMISGMACGLLLANLLECMRWTDCLAKFARPLARIAHFGNAASSAFTLAFVSPAAANALLSENFENGQLDRRELVLANLFNSLPANLTHMPTIFFLTWPVLGFSALVYSGLTLLAALGRTLFIMLLAHCILRKSANERASKNEKAETVSFRAGLKKTWHRFQRRLPKMVYFTVPFYVLVYIMQQCGYFQTAEQWLTENTGWLGIVSPQAMSIVFLQIVAEMGASLGAAGAVLESGALSMHEVIIAMLVGNLLSTPMRAIRHQLPVYAGFFKPGMALKLVLANQTLRAASMAIILFVYAYWPR